MLLFVFHATNIQEVSVRVNPSCCRLFSVNVKNINLDIKMVDMRAPTCELMGGGRALSIYSRLERVVHYTVAGETL